MCCFSAQKFFFKMTARDVPLIEITLRKYERPYQLSKRDVLKKMCLSLGLLQPGDKRDSIVDVLHTLLKSQKALDTETIMAKSRKNREAHNLAISGCSAPNIRRSLKRLKNAMLVEKVEKGYRIAEKASFSELIHDKIEAYLIRSTLDRIKEYASNIDNAFKLNEKQKS